jgi:hypothetical protein
MDKLPSSPAPAVAWWRTIVEAGNVIVEAFRAQAGDPSRHLGRDRTHNKEAPVAQATLQNQKNIIANQRAIVANQTKILRNQQSILKNQKKILSNQSKILRK